MPSPLATDPRLKQVHWRDLVTLSKTEQLWELTLSLPWLIASLLVYHHGYWYLGAPLSFFFFLTALRQAHNAQHFALGIGRAAHHALMFALSLLMLGSVHAVQTTHLHHHRHCLDEHDVEASHIRWRWWHVLLAGPLFPIRLHIAAWNLAAPRQRKFIALELVAILLLITLALAIPQAHALRWHIAAMAVGECMTGFFAVWIVHRGCDTRHIARTQRGILTNLMTYSMLYHLEHHLFPAIPTCHLPKLARRLDEAAPEYRERQVI